MYVRNIIRVRYGIEEWAEHMTKKNAKRTIKRIHIIVIISKPACLAMTRGKNSKTGIALSDHA